MAPLEGCVVVDKPAGMTSHDVVARARSALGERRIGHAGTLDPGATGVLVLAVGRATRLLQFVSGLPKRYSGEIVLGAATDTLDDEGDVVERADMSRIVFDDVVRAAERLTGDIDQIPPMVSALKVGGERLHSLKRRGIEVERAPRHVRIERFEVASTADPLIVAFDVECSSGTYVRVLAADLGTELGGVAHLRRLRRHAVGEFTLHEAVGIDDLSRADVKPAIGLLRHLAATPVDATLAAAVATGRVLERRALGVVGEGPWAVTVDGRLLAVYEPRSVDRVKPVVVLADGAAGAATDNHGSPAGR